MAMGAEGPRSFLCSLATEEASYTRHPVNPLSSSRRRWGAHAAPLPNNTSNNNFHGQPQSFMLSQSGHLVVSSLGATS